MNTMKEKIKEFKEKALEKGIIKLVLVALFFAYWLFTILYWISSKDEMHFVSILLKVFIYLPLTVIIGFSIYRFGPVFILAYSIYITLISILGFISNILNSEGVMVISYFSSFFSCIFGLLFLVNSIKIMTSKKEKFELQITLIIPILIIINIIEICLYKANNIESVNIFSFIASQVLMLSQGIFYVFFPNEEVKLFKE